MPTRERRTGVTRARNPSFATVSLILDTSALLAALDAGDPDHVACATLLEGQARAGVELLVPSTVLPELDYWISERLERTTWQVFIEDLLAGAYTLEQVTPDDLRRAAEIDAQYSALRLGLVDSSLVAVAERLGERCLATLNLRDFRAVVPAHCQYLTLWPADLP